MWFSRKRKTESPDLIAARASIAATDARIAALESALADIKALRPITIYEATSAQRTAAEIARLQALQGDA